MRESTQSDCCCTTANEHHAKPSFSLCPISRIAKARKHVAGRSRVSQVFRSATLAALCFVVGCSSEPAAKKTEPAAPPKPVELSVPDEIQSAAQSLLGVETQVLLFGDLAKAGKQQFLAANVVPKTPKNDAPGTIVTRAVIAENQDGKWSEVLRCDEHLKNSKGYLGLTPVAPVTGWRLQYEQDPNKGLQLYFTPLKGTSDPHVLPIGVRWNPANKRYQSLDHSYEHFLAEASTMGGTARSRLQ